MPNLAPVYGKAGCGPDDDQLTNLCGGMNKKVKMKPVPGHPDYLVTERGEVFSTKSNRFLTKRRDMNGYFKVGLTERNKQRGYMVHRLVAAAFIPNPCMKPFINHKDSKRDNNFFKNLEWVTAKENTAHAISLGRIKVFGSDNAQAKMNHEFIMKAKGLLVGKNVGQKRKIYSELIKESGTTREAIWMAVTGRTWKHIKPIEIRELHSRKKKR